MRRHRTKKKRITCAILCAIIGCQMGESAQFLPNDEEGGKKPEAGNEGADKQKICASLREQL
jgi:hypothetical protein